MSLTDELRDELLALPVAPNPLRAAELATIVRLAGGLHRISGRIALEVEVSTLALAEKIRDDLVQLWGAKATVVAAPHAAGSGGFVVRVLDAEVLARQTGLLDQRGRPVRGLPNRLTTGNPRELVALLRGAVLVSGTLTDPGRSGALEIVAPSNEAAMAIMGAAGRLQIAAKIREVRSAHRVVVREPEAIARLLMAVGARRTLVNWNEQRQRKEVRATANRLVNFDDANLRRSAQAAVAACARVERALEILGDDVPDHLAYAGNLRLAHRESSLDELGQHADPPMTKDAVAGRIRRLLALADKTAAEQGIPDTESAVPSE